MKIYIIDIPPDVKQFVKESVATEAELIVLLAYSTGAKLSDLINLKWKDIDFKNKKITFHSQKTQRTVTLVDIVVEKLSVQKKQNWKINSHKNAEYVFIKNNGGTETYHSLYYKFINFSKKSSVPYVKYKDLRITFYYFFVKKYSKLPYSYLYKYSFIYNN